MQLLSVFFGITIFMLFATYGYLLFKDYRFKQADIEMVQMQADVEKEIAYIKNRISFIEKENLLSENVFTKNTVLRDSISNMFDLVPQRITLSEAKLLDDGLVMYGITPNKDVYNFMLEAPLRSIFNRTYSSFYPAENGWLRFMSTNYIDKDEQEIPMKKEDDQEQQEQETQEEEYYEEDEVTYEG